MWLLASMCAWRLMMALTVVEVVGLESPSLWCGWVCLGSAEVRFVTAHMRGGMSGCGAGVRTTGQQGSFRVDSLSASRVACGSTSPLASLPAAASALSLPTTPECALILWICVCAPAEALEVMWAARFINRCLCLHSRSVCGECSAL
jgi:hypothetical protein